jgi:hypothetical protein
VISISITLVDTPQHLIMWTGNRMIMRCIENLICSKCGCLSSHRLFCATGINMGRWYGSEHTSCPNCDKPDEDAAHLLHCQDTGRFSLFQSEANKLAGFSSHTRIQHWPLFSLTTFSTAVQDGWML